MVSSWLLLDAVVAVVAVLFVDYVLKRKRRGSLPPGPRGWPLIGNVLDMPKSHEWKTFAQWGEKWGKHEVWPLGIASSI